jgi:hypothetical protein
MIELAEPGCTTGGCRSFPLDELDLVESIKSA